MDALKALRYYRTDSEQHRTLRCPVSGAAGAVLAARDDDERHAVGLVAHRRVVNAHGFASRVVRRPVALMIGCEVIPQPYVAESAAHHDVVVATPRSVGVERASWDIIGDEMLAGRRARRDAASWGDVISRYGIADLNQHACILDWRPRLRCQLRVGEVWRRLDVGAAGIPVETLRLLSIQRLPLLGSHVYRRVSILELL